MLSKNAIAIEGRAGGFRAIHVKGSPGRLEVASHKTVDGEDPLSACNALRTAGLSMKSVVVGVNGKDATLRYNLVPPVPDWRLELIMKYEAQDVVDKTGEPMASAWRTLEIPESESEDQVLLVGMGRESAIAPIVEAVEKGGGRAHLACPLAVALHHASQLPSKSNPGARAKDQTILAVDIGEDGSHVSISIDGRLVFARSVSVGADIVDESLASALQLDTSKIAKLRAKLAHGDPAPSEIAGVVETSLRSSFGQFVSMVTSSVTFCRAQTKIRELDLDRVIVSGEVSRIPGLIQYLEREVGAPVERFDPQIGGDVPPDVESWATTIGLAAAAMDPDEIVLDLLPEAAKAKREFRDRKVYQIAAAAILGAAILVHGVAYFLASSNAEAVTQKVKKNAQQVASYQQEQAEARTKNVVFRSRIQRLGGEVARPAFAARVVESLATVLPEGIAINKFETEREEAGGRTIDTVRITGTADDSERRGLDHIEAVELALASVPGARRVESDPGEKDELRGLYPFEIIVSSSEPPEKSSDSGRSSRRSGR